LHKSQLQLALALTPEHQSTEMSTIKNNVLDQYSAEAFKQQEFGTAGVERVKGCNVMLYSLMCVVRCAQPSR